MSKVTRIAIGGLGVVLVAVATGEHLYRRIVQFQYRQAVEGRRQAEQQLKEFIADHDRVKGELASEQQRTAELSQSLAKATAEVEQVQVHLTESQQKVRQLRARLETMDRQMGQLQGELSLALQRVAAAPPPEEGAVQLERVVIDSEDGDMAVTGRVVSVHKEWSFVVVSLGWNSVKIGDTISILRDDRLLAKAKVERVQEDVSAATLLPEWQDVEIAVNDLAQVL